MSPTTSKATPSSTSQALPQRGKTEPRVTSLLLGGFNLSNDCGERFAHITLAPQRGLGAARTAAARMAYASELTSACRQADIDYEKTGAVSCETITVIRRLLVDIGAA